MTIEERAKNLINELDLEDSKRVSLLEEVGDFLTNSAIDKIRSTIEQLDETYAHKLADFHNKLAELETAIKTDKKQISADKHAEDLEKARKLLNNL